MDTGDGADGGGRRVFLSYSRADQPHAMAVLRTLEDAGFDVWWDGLIPGGDRYNAITSDALETAGAVVVLWSKASVRSHWVQDEATRGRDRGVLIPLSIDGTEPPLGFRQFQYLDLSGAGMRPDSPAMARAVASVAAQMGRAPAAPVRTRARPTRRTLLIGGTGVVAVAAGAAGWMVLGDRDAASPNSLAVLPFDTLGGDPSQRYFSEGLSAELRSQLSRNPKLSVMGQASSNGFRDSRDDGRTIARKLGVGYLLDGNVRIAGDVVRIGLELIAGDTGFTRWSQSFDGPLTDIFRLQERIARSVDGELAATLTGAQEQRARSGGSTDVAAFDAYLRGRALFESQADEGSDRAALARFDEAIRLDPDYAAARAARARALAVIANQYAQSAERIRLYGAAVDEARAAIRAAPDFADGHAALGYALFYGQLDVTAANAPYERAHDLGAGSADILARYALYRARRRQFDRAAPAIARATQLDPLNPSAFKTAGLIRFAAGDYAGAIAAAQRALEINPARGTIHGDIGNALLMLGKVDEAAAAFGREKVGLLAIPGRAFVAARRGDGAGIAAAFAALVTAFGDNGLYQQAQVLAQWRKPAEALAALGRARATRDSGLVLLMNDPFLAPLRAEAGFQALLRDLHFL
ncbi:hypothetical protein ASG29_15150 [Sphingomonas sp. Leaf412]|uniref:TIR domain-containing protein n=1 Tax=Sphingomonas sp. Leaf412 TaxID=1736370 RepID=UPI0006F33ACD|nr:TIR domain-containing protein [Sphingomonas sp. Leaf412]KQT31297.1 hypothetical protein ASG29_15150 [Sphingomonas sp. Leaf412]